jgi:Flp pilus assembly protein TadB
MFKQENGGFVLIRLGIFVCGLLFVFRITKYNNDNKLLNANVFEKLILGNIFLTLLLSVVVFHSVFYIWIVILCAILTIAVTIFVTVKVREKQFRQDFVDYLDRVIALVRTGQGFAHALEHANYSTTTRNPKKIQKIVESLQFAPKSAPKNEFLAEILEELRWIQKFPGKTLQRLISFRRNLKIEERFRRRSGRIVRQVAVQVIFLLMLYFALLIFVVSYFGWKENMFLLLLSAGLFSLGLIIFYYLGSRQLWKI